MELEILTQLIGAVGFPIIGFFYMGERLGNKLNRIEERIQQLIEIMRK